ncbi:hypothetical protein BO94DRAFT_550931 [Aspergillus sclerotioniger CBS 115572]|uniref:Uncharacterized protein n=1 Tax=Aspergillus sclerotioniger CBS 115572 TaxID=1450535 RepID=A0A317VAK2_9EURO|nr:hypothetical protein BO94DRAFT_550931 [Aspergillus sclerotioniger CBS 115572]PWY68970.1 hypothetical protein BO94DRAFT_550931 [Aspergillus sclerotioniger CBS 115572]
MSATTIKMFELSIQKNGQGQGPKTGGFAKTVCDYMIMPEAPHLEPLFRDVSNKNIITLTVDITNPDIPMDWDQATRKLHKFFQTLRSQYPDAARFGGLISDLHGGEIRLFTESKGKGSGSRPVPFKYYGKEQLFLDRSQWVIAKWLKALPKVGKQESNVMATMVCDEEWKSAYKLGKDGPGGSVSSWKSQPKNETNLISDGLSWLFRSAGNMLSAGFPSR